MFVKFSALFTFIFPRLQVLWLSAEIFGHKFPVMGFVSHNLHVYKLQLL